MKFLYPLGLLGLIAIPVLVIIYIIKSKYTEQVIASTYIWTLSERFLKRKNPIKMITGIISLILQILAVVFISLAIAHPVFTLPGRANDFCFILDGSGSMNIVNDGATRFERGKDEIESIINSSANGSTYTLITTGNTTEVIFKNNDDKKSAIRQLNALTPSYVASDFDNAITVAQNYFNDNPSYKFYLVTDKKYSQTENTELICVAGEEENYALSDVTYAYTQDGVRVDGVAYTFRTAATVNVDLFSGDGKEAVGTARVELSAGAGVPFSIEAEVSDFSSLTVAIRESDALALDNSVVLYDVRNDATYKTLIVSDTPFFINAALSSMGNMQRDVVAPKNYTEELGKGYGLYVFENFAPEKMPADGAVWFVNPTAGTEGSGFSRRGVQELSGATMLQLSDSSSSKVKNLLKGTVSGDRTGVLSYIKCGLYRSFITLMTCNGDPVVFAGTNTYGNREVVFAFDFHTSDFPLTYNGRAVLHNLIDYTFPSLVDETGFYCGDTLTVNVLANCTGIRVESPSGSAEYLDTSEAICEYELTEVGVYTITATIGDNRIGTSVFSMLPESERLTSVTEASFIISGEPSTQKRDGRYEDLLYAFIILAVIVVADWMVYCYEQYQLR